MRDNVTIDAKSRMYFIFFWMSSVQIVSSLTWQTIVFHGMKINYTYAYTLFLFRNIIKKIIEKLPITALLLVLYQVLSLLFS